MKLPYHTTLPTNPRPILIIGAGGIVRDAHLPAYQIAGFPVKGITNRSVDKAEKLATTFGIDKVYLSIESMVADAPDNAIYDLTLPADQFVDALRKLPIGSAVLIQKPMGENLPQAEEILTVCRERNLTAAVNFQLRFAPYVVMARHAIQRGLIGDLLDFEIRINVETPWHLWTFLKGVPNMETTYHSVHYLDLVRSFLGNPGSIRSLSLPSQLAPGMTTVRSVHSLDYGSNPRVTIETNHGHRFGPKHQESYIKWEGTKGAIKAQIGLLLDYPRGVNDWFEICQLEEGKSPVWEHIPFEGSWFPHAFIGAMGELMNHLDTPSQPLFHSVDDVIHTMRLADAAYRSGMAQGGTTLQALSPSLDAINLV